MTQTVNLFRIEVDTGSSGYGSTDTLPELLSDVEIEYGKKEAEKVLAWSKSLKTDDEYLSEDGRIHIWNIKEQVFDSSAIVKAVTRENMDTIIESIMGVMNADWLSEESKPSEIESVLVNNGLATVAETSNI